MKSIHRTAVCGLLWLAFCAVASATPFTIATWDMPIEDGGGFSAYLNNNPADTFQVFCVDFQNFVTIPDSYDVNVDVVGNTVADTRYGTTPTVDFTDQVMINGSSVNAQMRYILAGWLTTQYNSNTGGSQDIGIQNAIWTLLNTNSSTHTDGDETSWLTNALTWAAGETTGQLNAFADNVEVFTTSTVSGESIPGRWTSGQQEMITVTGTPEPAAMALVGFSLLGLGLIGRRRLA